jgi:glycosyltransferase involved in cell wall biosynthesis
MNVLFVVGAFPPAFNEGGPGAMVYALSKQLVKSGHSVYVITTNKHVDEKLEYTDVEVNYKGIDVYYADWDRSIIPYKSSSLKRKVRDVVSNYDIMLLSSSWTYYGIVASKAALSAGVPYAIYTHGSYHPERLNKSKIKKYLWWLLFDRRMYHLANFIIVMSGEEKKHAITFGIKNNIVTFPIGIDDSLLIKSIDNSCKLASVIDRNYFLFLSRVSKIKNIERTMVVLKDTLIQNDIQFVVAGQGDSNYIANLKSFAKNLGIADRVVFLGQVSMDEKICLLIKAKFFVLLSRAEGLPQSVIEAMYFSLPTLVTRECNMSDAVNNNALILIDNEHDMSKVKALLSDDMCYHKQALIAHEYAEKNFNWEVIVKKMIIFMESVLEVKK